MKPSRLKLLPLLLVASSFSALPLSAQIVGAYWSFNSGSGSTFTPDVNTFAGTAPTATRAGSNMTLFRATDTMGDDFADFQGTVWPLNGADSLAWNEGSTDNSLTLRADLTDLEQINLSLRYRTQTAGTVPGFSAFEYRTSADGAWEAVTFDGSLLFAEPNSSTFQLWEAGITGATAAAVEGSSFAEFRLSFGSVANTNFRIDDVQITAIPEPTTYAAIFGLGVLGLVLLRRRR